MALAKVRLLTLDPFWGSLKLDQIIRGPVYGRANTLRERLHDDIYHFFRSSLSEATTIGFEGTILRIRANLVGEAAGVTLSGHLRHR